MSSRYDDIINLPHHVSQVRKPMPLASRAAQFAPFAALTGHDDAIRETARATAVRPELSGDELAGLSRRLAYALSICGAEITVGYFGPDRFKSGGACVSVTGRIKRVDEISSVLEMAVSRGGGSCCGGQIVRIPMTDIVSIEGDIFNGQE